MKKTVLVLTILSFGISFAQQREDFNLKGEKKRVVNGVKSGEINKSEAVVISKQAEDVKRAENKAKADGIITKNERARIAKQDAQLDRTIYRKKHN